MKKILSILLLTASYNFVLFPITPKNKNNTYFKFDENEKIWKYCTEINKDEAECINASEYLGKIIAILNLFKQNEEQAKELVKNIAIAQTQHFYLILKMNFENGQKEKNLSKEEQKAAQLEFEKRNPFLNKSVTKSPSILDEWINKKNNPEYIRSILPEEEQKMLDAIKEMSIKFKEKAENKN